MIKKMNVLLIVILMFQTFSVHIFLDIDNILHRNSVSPVCRHKGWSAGVSDGAEVDRADPPTLPDGHHQNQ